MKPANFRRPAYCFAFEVERVHHVILTLHIISKITLKLVTAFYFFTNWAKFGKR